VALGREETPDLADVARREEVKVELQEEYRLSDEASLARDARIRAFFISITLVACLLLPLVGLIAGLTVRAFKWSAGW